MQQYWTQSANRTMNYNPVENRKETTKTIKTHGRTLIYCRNIFPHIYIYIYIPTIYIYIYTLLDWFTKRVNYY